MKHRVLVIDDDVDLRETLISVLEDEGYEAVGAVDGVHALEQLATGPLPCVILLDLMMPNMDGQQFRQEQLQDAKLARVPVIVLSAYRDVAERAAALALDHLPKPIKLADLRAAVHRFCPLGSN